MKQTQIAVLIIAITSLLFSLTIRSLINRVNFLEKTVVSLANFTIALSNK